jgi:hypothetical protein
MHTSRKRWRKGAPKQEDEGRRTVIDDTDAVTLDEAEARGDLRKVGDQLERIESRLQKTRYGILKSIELTGLAIVVLLALILWRIW